MIDPSALELIGFENEERKGLEQNQIRMGLHRAVSFPLNSTITGGHCAGLWATRWGSREACGKKQPRTLEIKNTITKIKNSVDSFDRLDTVEDRIYNLEREITYSRMRRQR